MVLDPGVGVGGESSSTMDDSWEVYRTLDMSVFLVALPAQNRSKHAFVWLGHHCATWLVVVVALMTWDDVSVAILKIRLEDRKVPASEW